MRVLVCEDSPETREFIGNILFSYDIDFVEAEDGEIGLAEFLKQPFDLVITDLNMPHKDGMYLSRDIRQHNKNIPIIMFSSVAHMVPVEMACSIGINHLIDKISWDELLRTILHYKKIMEQ